MNQQVERSSNIVSDFIESYFERRMARILLLGMISGFPAVLIGSSLSLWLKEDGLSRSTIGFAGAIFAVYGFNWLWAPLIDRLRVPVLTDRLGHSESVDPDPAGGDPCLPVFLEHHRSDHIACACHRCRPDHRHLFGNAGHHHRCAADRADRPDDARAWRWPLVRRSPLLAGGPATSLAAWRRCSWPIIWKPACRELLADDALCLPRGLSCCATSDCCSSSNRERKSVPSVSGRRNRPWPTGWVAQARSCSLSAF